MNCVKFRVVTRYLPTSSVVRISHQLKTTKSNKENPKVSPDVVKYLESFSEYSKIKDKLPKFLLRKYGTTENMYVINKQTANEIVKAITQHISPSDPVVEVNPGIGVLSERLLKAVDNKIYMFENSTYFTPYLSKIQEEYPERVSYKIGDFLGMWKLAFKDNIDNGSRMKELLGDLYCNDNKRIVKIIGSMPGLNFIKHLMNNIVFHNTNNQLGHPDLFITMPAHHYAFLTDSQIQKGKHKSLPALFQLLFDYRLLTKLPKVHFLPWTHPPNIKKKLSVLDENNVYLVNITQKSKLPCPPEYLPLLRYFFKPQMFSTSTKVIPMLEQWIPGCGIWLISGQDPPDTNKLLSPGEDDEKLPHMTIFTEFGDLTLGQKITVFKRFISWPEFEQSPFKVTMENNLPKFVLNLEDDDKESFGTHIEEIDHSDTEEEK